MSNKRIFFLILLFLAFVTLISINFVTAIGISAVRLNENLNFVPGLERTFEYRIGTNTDHAMYYEIFVKEDLAPYITPSISKVFIEPNSGYNFQATLKLPQYLSPGMHTGYICVLETETMGGKGANVGVRTEVCAIINVKVLYPGKYLVINNFDIYVENKLVNFKLDVENWGTEDITSARSSIDISEANKTGKLATVESDSYTVASNSKASIISSLNAESFKVGDYVADAIVNYDGQKVNTSKIFKLGELELRFVNYTKEFEENKISPMDIEVESIWNQQIKDIYVEVNLSKNGKNLQILKTSPETIEPWGRTTLRTFLDSNGLALGPYDVSLSIYYAGKLTAIDGIVNVTSKQKSAEIPKLSVSANTILLLAILLLLVILILLVLRRKKRKETIN